MRLPEEVVTPSTSTTYLPYDAKDKSEPLFGYNRKEVVSAPWATRRYDLSIDGLHEEIMDVYHWLKPSRIETAVRLRVFEKVQSAIKDRWKDFDVRVSVFGSLRTQLFLPTSDIDVLVECTAWKDTDIVSILEKTAVFLHDSGLAETIQVYGDAFVPIVKMVDKDTRVSIDISFNTVQGVKAADYIDKVKGEFPVVEPLVLILKQFLIQRNLNQTFTGGLSSYGLILMLISFLQVYAMSVRHKSFYTDGVNLGELLMRFFEVYAHEFNYLEVGISVASGTYCPKKTPRNNTDKAPVLSLEDPLLITNEVGRSTFNFSGVQRSFAQALQVLKGVFVRDRRRSPLFSDRVYNGSMLSLIMPFTPQQIRFRNWLKSFSLSYPAENVPTSQFITNTLLAPVVDLASVRWHAVTVTAPKPSKALTIENPNNARKSDFVEEFPVHLSTVNGHNVVNADGEGESRNDLSLNGSGDFPPISNSSARERELPITDEPEPEIAVKKVVIPREKSRTQSNRASSSSSASSLSSDDDPRKAWNGRREQPALMATKQATKKPQPLTFAGKTAPNADKRTPSPSENTTPPGDIVRHRALLEADGIKVNNDRSRSNSDSRKTTPRTFANAVLPRNNRSNASLQHKHDSTRARVPSAPVTDLQNGGRQVSPVKNVPPKNTHGEQKKSVQTSRTHPAVPTHQAINAHHLPPAHRGPRHIPPGQPWVRNQTNGSDMKLEGSRISDGESSERDSVKSNGFEYVSRIKKKIGTG